MNRSRLLQLLEAYCRVQQSDDQRDFFSIREVAEHFGVSRTLTHEVFHKLHDLGLLILKRGSGAILASRSGEHSTVARGRVGVIVPLQTFQLHQGHARACMELPKAFRTAGFITDLYFCNRGGALDEVLLDEIRRARTDWLLWLEPTRAAVPAMLRLRDAGVEILSVGTAPALVPARHWQIEHEKAARSAFEAWRQRASKS